MTPTARQTPTIVPEDTLQAAAKRLLLDQEESEMHGAATQDRRREVEGLVEALRALLDGGELPALGPAEADRIRLLQALRNEVLDIWPADEPLLRVMRAFEVVQGRLVAHADRLTIDEVLTPSSRSVLREVAHMLRSPFGSIVMLTDTLREQGGELSPERRNRLLGIIHRAALGIATTAGDILTSIGQGEGVGPDAPFTLRHTLEDVAHLLRPVTEVRGCELVVHAPDEPSLVGPASGVSRAVLGMALRAALRTRDGSVELCGALDEERGRATFSVRARGSGAEPEEGVEDLLRVFRMDADGGKSYTLSADGLGLAATQQLIDSMGSELEMESEADGALRLFFTLELPAKH